MAFPMSVFDKLGNPDTRDEVAIALTLDPHIPLGGKMVSQLEKVIADKKDILLTRQNVSKGICWTNIPPKLGFTKDYIYKQIHTNPSLVIIQGYWPLPLTLKGDYCRYIWTWDWPGQMNSQTADLILKSFDPASSIMYNILE